MRRLLERKAVMIIAVIISVTAIPAGIVATATPAQAVGPFRICTAAGNHYCVGAPTIGFGDPVEATAGGRLLNRVDQGFTCCGGYNVIQLQFDADHAKCVGVPDGSFEVTVRACSGGNGTNTNWAEEFQPDGSVKYFSNPKNAFLTSNNHLNNQLSLTLGCDGCFLRWGISGT